MPRLATECLAILLIASGAPTAVPVVAPQELAKKEADEGHVRQPLPSPEEIAKLPPDGGDQFNRLIHESSPYLLQHARNPVDWHPWGEEAFEKARRKGKPIFLSIGYSTCHWCHVMERESFESEEIAKLLNAHFVPIKVDREERPDIDQIYMTAVQAMTGSGGWPMSLFLTPEGKPFWGGTYFPPEDRFGRPGFASVLKAIADAWRTKRNEILEGADRLTAHIRAQGSGTAAADLGEDTLRKALGQYVSQFDPTHGGFGPAPKFPRTHSLSFLLRFWKRSGNPRALSMVEETLDAMARGGIRDHLGGGFHRYSTDREWLVPHFEKMLYDQALLARTYLEAYQATRTEEYAGVVRDIFRYLLRDLADESGGFHSAEDADSEGVEGRFYVWAHSEILAILGTEDAELFSRVYGVRKDGNFRDEATGEETGRNILHLARPLADVAGELEVEPEKLEERLEPMRRRLFEARERRVRPLRDDKILADWNGLAISALAFGGQVLDEEIYVEAAATAASFVLSKMQKDGRLLHRYRGGKAAIPAYLDDHAFLALGLLDLYEATFDPRWLREATRLLREMVRLFWDTEGKGFLFTGRDAPDLIAETKEIYDGAVPSGNSVAALALLRAARLTMDRDLEKRAEEALGSFSGEVDRFPMAYPFLLMALDFTLGPSREIVLAGEPGEPGLEAMRRAISERFIPNKVVALHPSGAGAKEIEALVPFLAEQVSIDGKATAYVCENYACQLPTTEVEEMVRLLGE